jgi:hypothetical protein
MSTKARRDKDFEMVSDLNVIIYITSDVYYCILFIYL